MRRDVDTPSWLPRVLLEIPELDEDHGRLLGFVNALIAAVAFKAPPGVQWALSELRSETEAHFAREETLMRKTQYPRLQQHSASHRRLLRELGALRVVLQASGMLRLPLVPKSYIGRWFVAHLAQEDRMVASYLDETEDKVLIGLA